MTEDEMAGWWGLGVRNRILARVENGWHLIGWSICISLEEGSLAK